MIYSEDIWQEWVQRISEDLASNKTSFVTKYIHFDHPFNFSKRHAELRSLFATKNAIAKHSFAPFIKIILKTPRYKFQEDLDFGTNYMAKDSGGNPNIFETEIHSGIYRGTILIELDRVGEELKGAGKKEFSITNEDKAKRVNALIDAFQMLWSSGRQSRFLADISPKFIASALMKSKNPIFLEALKVKRDGQVDVEALKSVTNDYSPFIDQSVFATQEGVFTKNDDTVVSLGEGFATMKGWVNSYYGV